MCRLAILALIFFRPTMAGLLSPAFDSFQTFTTPNPHIQGPDARGQMYFDSYSYKAVNANIAYFILGTEFFSVDPNSPRAALPYLGSPDGGALASFNFRSSVSLQAELLYAAGSWSPYSSLGWYDLSETFDRPACMRIFQANGSAPSLRTISFTPSSHFGLCFVPNDISDPSNAYYTDASKNQIAAEDVTYAADHNISLFSESGRHFAVFKADPNDLYIGVEDRSLQVGDGDYTDLVFRLTPESSVPEPGSFLLVAAVLVGLGAIRQKRLN
jgi:hypothetical protein